MVRCRLRQLVLCLALLPACSSAPDGSAQPGSLNSGGIGGTSSSGGTSGSGGTAGAGTAGGPADCSALPSLEEEVRHATCDNYMGAARCCMRGEVTEANVGECVGTYDWTIDRESHKPIAAPAVCRGLVDATLDCANSLARSDCVAFLRFYDAAVPVDGEILDTGDSCLAEAHAAYGAGCGVAWSVIGPNR